MAEFRFVTEPNLPNTRVKTVIIGSKYADILSDSLQRLGVGLLCIPENAAVSQPVSAHADMSVCHVGGSTIIAALSLYDTLHGGIWDSLDIICAEQAQNSIYPFDIGLNACIVGDRLLHNLNYTDPALLKAAGRARLRSYTVSQGYTKCSVCVVDRTRIITSDAGIHRTASALGLKSLLIQPGGIALPGYDSGFIGGCCVKLDRDLMAFTGTLNRHPDRRRVTEFLGQAGVRTVYLTDKPLFDVGSILPILEEA